MGFLDNLTQSGQAVADKFKSATDSAAISNKIAKEKDALAKYYKDLGVKFYEQNKDSAEGELGEICRYISQTMLNIAALEEEKDKVRGIVRCASCGAECQIGKNFCTNCGAKLPASEPAPAPTAETPATPAPEAAPAPAAEEKPAFCRNCGNTLASDAMFCTNCGTRV